MGVADQLAISYYLMRALWGAGISIFWEKSVHKFELGTPHTAIFCITIRRIEQIINNYIKICNVYELHRVDDQHPHGWSVEKYVIVNRFKQNVDDFFTLNAPLTWFHAVGCFSYIAKYCCNFWRIFWLLAVMAKWKKHKYISVSQCDCMNWRRESFFRFLFLSFPIMFQFVFVFL